MTSILTKNQKMKFGPKLYTEKGVKYRITATVRYDDDCGNGHNSFSITGSIDRQAGNGGWVDDAGGCIHDQIAKHFPQLKQYIKWHLTSSDGPMHYIENSLYWAGHRNADKPNYDYFRSTAIWPEMTDDRLKAIGEKELTKALNNRLNSLMAEFKRAVESLGLTY